MDNLLYRKKEFFMKDCKKYGGIFVCVDLCDIGESRVKIEECSWQCS